MATKTKAKKKFYVRRSYEPLKVTVAVSAFSAVILVLFALIGVAQ